MSGSIFDWSYPPGCSGPPEDPPTPPESDDVWNILEAAGVDQSIIRQVDTIIIALAEKLAAAQERDCAVCERRANEEERKRDQAEVEWVTAGGAFAAVSCPHGNQFSDCNACASLSDWAYDAARERRS